MHEAPSEIDEEDCGGVDQGVNITPNPGRSSLWRIIHVQGVTEKVRESFTTSQPDVVR